MQGVLLVSFVACHLDSQIKTDLYKTTEPSLKFLIDLHKQVHADLYFSIFTLSLLLVLLAHLHIRNCLKL
jgi:hypothetical protein